MACISARYSKSTSYPANVMLGLRFVVIDTAEATRMLSSDLNSIYLPIGPSSGICP